MIYWMNTPWFFSITCSPSFSSSWENFFTLPSHHFFYFSWLTWWIPLLFLCSLLSLPFFQLGEFLREISPVWKFKCVHSDEARLHNWNSTPVRHSEPPSPIQTRLNLSKCNLYRPLAPSLPPSRTPLPQLPRRMWVGGGGELEDGGNWQLPEDKLEHKQIRAAPGGGRGREGEIQFLAGRSNLEFFLFVIWPGVASLHPSLPRVKNNVPPNQNPSLVALPPSVFSLLSPPPHQLSGSDQLDLLLLGA